MNQPIRILLVEDDSRLAELIRAYLKKEGFDIRVTSRGDKAVRTILEHQPDLVILDLMLPGKDGLSICQEVRPRYGGVILILTAREDDMDQVAGLEMGADDYVKKPVVPRVLLARIRTLLRRCKPFQASPEGVSTQSSAMVFGRLEIRPSAVQVFLDGNPVGLTTSEFDLLRMLARGAGHIIDRDRLYRELRGIEYDGMDRSMDVSISRLRKKLGDDPKNPKRIKTVWGKGYLFVKDAW